MGAFSVDPAALDEAQELMDAFERHVEQMCSALDKLVSDLHISWSGDGADAHDAAHREWTTGASEMRAAIADLKSSAANAAANYRGAGEANTGMWPS